MGWSIELNCLKKEGLTYQLVVKSDEYYKDYKKNVFVDKKSFTVNDIKGREGSKL